MSQLHLSLLGTPVVKHGEDTLTFSTRKALLAFLYLLAAWAIITGILEFIAPLSFPMSTGRAVLMVLAGLASIVFGILIASQPSSGLLAVVWLIGVYAIVFGIMHVIDKVLIPPFTML